MAQNGPITGSQHQSPNVTSETSSRNFWPEIITSRDAESACFKGSRTSCDMIDLRIFWPDFGRKRSHHVMDASCRNYFCQNSPFAALGPLSVPYQATLTRNSSSESKRFGHNTTSITRTACKPGHCQHHLGCQELRGIRQHAQSRCSAQRHPVDGA